MLKEQGPEVPGPGQQARLLIPISSPWSQHMEEGRRKGYEVTHGLKGKSRGESGLGRKWGSRQTQHWSGLEACDWT